MADGRVCADMNLVKKTFENWDEILPGLAVLVGIGTAVAMAFLDPRVAAIAGPLLGLVSYISGWIFEWPFDHWYRLGPVPGTRLDKPVGLLPSGIDLRTERSRTINMFTAEGHTWPKYDKWPDYIGAGVYNLAADRVRGKSKANWKKLRKLIVANKTLRGLAMAAFVMAVAALYGWIRPQALEGLENGIAPELVPPIGIAGFFIGVVCFLVFVHLKARHMTELYRTANAMQQIPRPTQSKSRPQRPAQTRQRANQRKRKKKK